MKNQKGFAALEGLLILVIAGLIAGTGWYVWRTKTQTDKTLNQAENTSQSTISSNSGKLTDNGKFIVVIQKDRSYKQMAPSELSDKLLADALTAFKEKCSSGDSVGISYVLLENQANYRHDDSHIYITTGCLDAGKPLENNFSGVGAYLHKLSDATWTVDSVSQSLVNCSDVDNKGYTVTTIPICFDSTTNKQRIPKV